LAWAGGGACAEAVVISADNDADNDKDNSTILRDLFIANPPYTK